MKSDIQTISEFAFEKNVNIEVYFSSVYVIITMIKETYKVILRLNVLEFHSSKINPLYICLCEMYLSLNLQIKEAAAIKRSNKYFEFVTKEI